MRSPVGEGRERLLQALFDEFGETGPSPKLSMRQVAERLGVHHTLLTYHFGSRPGLLSAVLSEARRRDNLVIAAMGKDLGFAALCRAIWTFYSNAEHEAAALREGFTMVDAKQQSIIATACLRGLLLQRLLTPDAEVDAAAERFITSLTASTT